MLRGYANKNVIGNSITYKADHEFSADICTEIK